MGNCLKTQLKEIVQNDNLVQLDEFKFTLPAGLVNKNFSFCGTNQGDTPVPITINLVSGTCTLTVAGEEASFPFTDTSYYWEDTYKISTTTECVFSIKSKYDIHKFPEAIHYASKPVSLNSLKYSGIRYMEANTKPNNGDSAITGNLNTLDLEHWIPSFVQLDNVPNILGDVKDFAEFNFANRELAVLNLFNSRLSGSIEGFVSAMRNKEFTTSPYTIKFGYMNNIITFRNVPVPVEERQFSLTWTADTITFDGITVNA